MLKESVERLYKANSELVIIVYLLAEKLGISNAEIEAAIKKANYGSTSASSFQPEGAGAAESDFRNRESDVLSAESNRANSGIPALFQDRSGPINQSHEPIVHDLGVTQCLTVSKDEKDQ